VNSLHWKVCTDILQEQKFITEDEKLRQERLLPPSEDISSVRHLNDFKQRRDESGRIKAYSRLQKSLQAKQNKLVNVKQQHVNFMKLKHMFSDNNNTVVGLVQSQQSKRQQSPIKRPTSAPPSSRRHQRALRTVVL
jgi:hypothetical protein